VKKAIVIKKWIKKEFSVVGKHWHKCCARASFEDEESEYRRVEYGEQPTYLNYPDPFNFYWVFLTRKRK